MATSSSSPKLTPKPRNLHTQALNRRESIWQIYVPLGAVLVAVGALIALTVFAAGMPLRSAWADVSLIYLIIWAGLGSLLVLAFLAALCVGLWYLLRELPPYFKMAQDFMQRVAFRAAEISKQVASVFIQPRASAAAAQKTLDSVRSIITPRRKA